MFSCINKWFERRRLVREWKELNPYNGIAKPVWVKPNFKPHTVKYSNDEWRSLNSVSRRQIHAARAGLSYNNYNQSVNAIVKKHNHHAKVDHTIAMGYYNIALNNWHKEAVAYANNLLED